MGKKKVRGPHLPLPCMTPNSHAPCFCTETGEGFSASLLVFALPHKQLPASYSSFFFCEVIFYRLQLWPATCVYAWFILAYTCKQIILPMVQLLFSEFLWNYLFRRIVPLIMLLPHVAGQNSMMEINFDTCKGISSPISNLFFTVSI